MRERAKEYIYLCLQTDGYEPNDADVKAYLDLRDQLGVVEYDWVDVNIIGTSLALRTKVVIYNVGILVGDPLEWLALLVESKMRICSSFDDYMVPLYEGILTRISLRVSR